MRSLSRVFDCLQPHGLLGLCPWFSRQEWEWLRHTGKFKFSKLLWSLVRYTGKQERKNQCIEKASTSTRVCLICKDFKYFDRHSAQGNDVTSHWESVKVNIKAMNSTCKNSLRRGWLFWKTKNILIKNHNKQGVSGMISKIVI